MATEQDAEIEAMAELEADKFVERAKAPEEEIPVEAPKEPFEITLYFKNGLVHSCLSVTELDLSPIPNVGIIAASWAQDAAMPGEDLMQYIDWKEVQLVTVRTLDRPNRAARRGR